MREKTEEWREMGSRDITRDTRSQRQGELEMN